MDVNSGETVLEEACEARISGGVCALRDGTAEDSLGIRGLEHVKGRPVPVSGAQSFNVSAEGAAVVITGRGAHGEGNESCGQEGPFE
jgi:hypothetical protein